jgi:hypothetical protein
VVECFVLFKIQIETHHESTRNGEVSDMPNVVSTLLNVDGGLDHEHDFFNRLINCRYVPASSDRSAAAGDNLSSPLRSIRAASEDGPYMIDSKVNVFLYCAPFERMNCLAS